MFFSDNTVITVGGPRYRRGCKGFTGETVDRSNFGFSGHWTGINLLSRS